MAKKTFILGTQSLISSEDSTLRFGSDNEIVIPFPEGIDELEKISNDFTEKARIAKKLLEYFSSFNISQILSTKGVKQKNGSTLRLEKEYQDEKIPVEFKNSSLFDKRRIQIATALKKKYPEQQIILVSKKPAFRMKALSLGFKAQNFKDDIFPTLNEQYTGRIDCTASKDKIDTLYADGYILPKDIVENKEIEWQKNVFLKITSLTDNFSALAYYNGKEITPLQFSKAEPCGIIPKNDGQSMVLEALLKPPQVAPIVIVKGAPGTGKTLLSLAVALDKTKGSDRMYRQILVSTPTETIREENLGFLPGELEEKFDPYLGGVIDNLNILSSKIRKGNNKKAQYKQENGRKLINDGTVVLQLIGHLRGRSITDTFFIIDETQNIEPSVIKSIVTRAGENSKFVFLGDPTQIDNPNLNERFNGLVYLSEKMKGNKLCWQVTLKDKESVRSELAYIAAKIL